MTDQQAYIIIAIIFTVACLIPVYWQPKNKIDSREYQLLMEKLIAIYTLQLTSRSTFTTHIEGIVTNLEGMNDYNHKAFELVIKEQMKMKDLLQADIKDIDAKLFITGKNLRETSNKIIKKLDH
jgi:hypothetical protein